MGDVLDTDQEIKSKAQNLPAPDISPSADHKAFLEKYPSQAPFIGPGPEPTLGTTQRLLALSLAVCALNVGYHISSGSPILGQHYLLTLSLLAALLWLVYWSYFGVFVRYVPALKAQHQDGHGPLRRFQLSTKTWWQRLLTSAIALPLLAVHGWQLLTFRPILIQDLTPGTIWVHPRQEIEAGVVGDHEGAELAELQVGESPTLLRLGALNGPYFIHRVGTGEFKNCKTRLLDMGLSWVFRINAKEISWDELQPSPTCERSQHRMSDS